MAVAVKGPSVGIPVKLFREAESHPVTVELKSGDVYRGTLEESEDSMSCLLKAVHHTARDGRVMRLEAVYLRGSQIRFVVLPELLKGAPLFQCVGGVWGEGRAGQRRGRAGKRGGCACSSPAGERARAVSHARARLTPTTRTWAHARLSHSLRTPFGAAQKSQAVCRGQGQAAGVGSRAGRAGRRAGRARRRAGQGPRRQERHSRNKCVRGAQGGARWACACAGRRPLSGTRLTPPSLSLYLPTHHTPQPPSSLVIKGGGALCISTARGAVRINPRVPPAPPFPSPTTARASEKPPRSVPLQSMGTWIMSPCRTSGSHSERDIKCVSPLFTCRGPEAVCTTPQSAMACTGTLSSLGGLRLCEWGSGVGARGSGR